MAATLDLAISAIRSGRKEEGRQLLNLLIQENPNNDKAWLWMSSVVNTDEQRARCLYHVLAIDPNSEIARRGLNLLGIIVSDSRPVKIPRDSRPIHIPKPTPPGQERRPFLIDPQAITQELPFTPVTTPFAENIEASPSVLAIDVEDEAAGQDGQEVTQGNQTPVDSTEELSKPVLVEASPESKKIDTQPLPDQSMQPIGPANPLPTASASVETQQMMAASQMPNTQPQNPSEPVPVVSSNQPPGMASQPIAPMTQPQNPSEPVPVVQNVQPPGIVSQPQSNPAQSQPGTQTQGSNLTPSSASPPAPNTQSSSHPFQPLPANQQPYGQPDPGVPGPNQAHPSQSVPVAGPNPNTGMPPSGQAPSYPMPPQGITGHANVTMGMPPQNPSQPAPPIHSSTTMGMPLPDYTQQPQHPSEPVPVTPPSGQMGMMPYGQPQTPPQSQQGAALHSNSTMMMPTYPEAEARARLAASQPILPTNPNFAYQSGMVGDPMVNAYGSMPHTGGKTKENDEEGVNILAVIIFGTLSVTALGGLGMLILLVFTAPPA